MSTYYSVQGHDFHHGILYEVVSPILVPVPLSICHRAIYEPLFGAHLPH